MSRNDEEKVKGDVGVVCGARKPFGTARRGGSGMRNRRDGVPGDQRGLRGDVGDWRDMLPAGEASFEARLVLPRFRCVFAGESEQKSVCSLPRSI